MKYILLCYSEEQAWAKLSQAEQMQAMSQAGQLVGQLKSSGQYLASAPLEPIATATSVRAQNGKRLVTDGPFAETREVLGGFYLIDVANLDEAIAIAKQHPCLGTVEIRPLAELPDLP
jgi:hypothetical protein